MTDRNQIAEGVVFDCQLLAAVVHTLTGLGDINMACRMVEWFGQQRPSYKPVLEFEISDSQENHHSKASQSDSNALCHPFLPDILRGTVKVDTLLINQLMTHLAKMYRFNSVYNIFSSMTDVYNVYPDESTLAILAKTALTSAKVKKKGLIPDYAEDLWAIDGYNLARSQGNESFFTQSANRRNNGHSSQETGIIARETGVWDGRDPINRVMEMYWSMLEHNFDAAHSIALQDDMRVTSNGFFSFGGKRKVSPVQEEVNLDEGSEEAAADTALPVEQYHLTSALESTHSADDYTYAWPSLYPTKINMHMLVVLSGYLGRASDIPLIMSHMKVLHIKPRQSTLCLALWLYEESGVYATEMRKFRTWLGDWLGGAGVPSDETIGAFRARQWGGRKTL